MSRPFSPHCVSEPDRRQLLAGGAGLFALIVTAPARANRMPRRRRSGLFAGGKDPAEGKVTLDIAPLVENGNAVSFEVVVDHPMLADNHVREIALFTEKNPQPEVIVFRLTPAMGRPCGEPHAPRHDAAHYGRGEALGWLLLAERREVIVTIAACTEE